MRRKIKWIFTIIAVVFFVFLGSKVPNDHIGKRAMAVGLGIDLDDDGNIVACAQILMAATSDEGSSPGTRVVEAREKVLSAAIAKISEVCGMPLTVTHCNIVVLGEKLMKCGDAYKPIMTLMENTYVSDNAYMFVCEGEPKDVFETKTAFGNNASLYLQEVVSATGPYNNIPYKMLRQAIVGQHDIGKTTYFPYMKKVYVPPKVPSSSEEGTPKREEPEFSYNLNNVFVLKDGKEAGLYGEEAVKSINYVMTKIKKGSDVFEIPAGTVGIYVLQNEVKKEYDLGRKTLKVKLKIGGTVKSLRAKNVSVTEETFVYELTEEDRKICSRKIKKEIESFFAEMQEKDADVFNVRQSFYSKYGKKSEKLQLKDVKLELEVELEIEK